MPTAGQAGVGGSAAGLSLQVGEARNRYTETLTQAAVTLVRRKRGEGIEDGRSGT